MRLSTEPLALLGLLLLKVVCEVGRMGDISFFLSLANLSRGFIMSPNSVEGPPVEGINGCSINHSLAVSSAKFSGNLPKYAFLLANIEFAIELDRKVPACAIALTRDLHMASLVSMSKSEIGSLPFRRLMPPVKVSTADTARRACLDCCSISMSDCTVMLDDLESTPEYLSRTGPDCGGSGRNLSL